MLICVCVLACVYARVCVCVRESRTHTHIRTYVYARTHAYAHTPTRVRAHTRAVSVCARMCVGVCECVLVYVYVHVLSRVHTSRRLTPEQWRMLSGWHHVLNHCHQFAGTAALENQANICRRVSMYHDTLQELEEERTTDDMDHKEVRGFAAGCKRRMQTDEADYLCDAATAAHALSPLTDVSQSGGDVIRDRLLQLGTSDGDAAEGEDEHTQFVDEVDRFVGSRPYCPSTTTELEWYVTHKDDFPLLAALARDYLPINSTSVDCERLFSVVRLLIACRRTSLGDNTVRWFVEYRFWWEYLSQYNRRCRRRRDGEEALHPGSPPPGCARAARATEVSVAGAVGVQFAVGTVPSGGYRAGDPASECYRRRTTGSRCRGALPGCAANSEQDASPSASQSEEDGSPAISPRPMSMRRAWLF
eukprot:GHVU01074944.1.p1 GENE.GHVU01074944.1~~GHVU01074944.1.p1  ORF type:complete len:418 (+),score=24.36 GHVU01074944.1:255-1508(+)